MDRSDLSRREQQLNDLILNKKIKGITYYLLNRPEYLYPNQAEQLVDAGVQLELEDGTCITFGWDFRYVIMDIYNERFVDVVKAYNAEIPYAEINVADDEKWQPLIGKTISKIYFTWNWFEDIEEQRHYIPQDIEFILEDHHYLAICTTAYKIDEDGISILGPDSEGELLCLFSEDDTKYFKRGRFYEPSPSEYEEPGPEDFGMEVE